LTVRRLKTYASDTGRVYDYYFVERRPAPATFGAAIEYVYEVSSDRHFFFAVSIFVLDEAVADWAARHGRALDDNERYAAAKLALQRLLTKLKTCTSLAANYKLVRRSWRSCWRRWIYSFVPPGGDFSPELGRSALLCDKHHRAM